MTTPDEVQSWPVNIGGVPYTISLARTETGKLAVRANGRVAAKPIAPDESECVFGLAGATCTLSRERDGSFSLVVNQPRPDLDPGPASSVGTTFIQPRFLVWGFIGLLFIAPVLWVLSRSSYENIARRRVENILRGMSAPLDSVTVALWARDVRNLADNNELSWASDKFDRWRYEKDLGQTLKSWKVIDVEEMKGTDVPTAVVSVEIDGKPYAMKVPERLPISWAQ